MAQSIPDHSSQIGSSTRSPRVRIIVVYNPAAGRSRHALLSRTLACLRDAGSEVLLLSTQGSGDAERFAKEQSQQGRADVVVAAGGDGTINEVINGLAGSTVPLAIIPMGTANVLAVEIGLARDPKSLANTILHGPVQAITLGRVGERMIAVMAGIGFDARVVDGVSLRLKRVLGKGAYVIEALRQFILHPGSLYRVLVDGNAFMASSVIVANGRYYGGHYLLAPAADLASEGFQVCLFERSGRWNLLRYLLAVVTSRVPRLTDCRVVEGRRVYVSGGTGNEPVQGDGDTVSRLPVLIEAVPNAIKLVMPV